MFEFPARGGRAVSVYLYGIDPTLRVDHSCHGPRSRIAHSRIRHMIVRATTVAR